MSAQLMLLPNGKWGAKTKKTRYYKSPDGGVMSAPDFEEKFMDRTLEEVSEFLLQRGIDDNEIDVAVEQMLKNEHNIAEFGVLGGFIFSKYVGVLH